MARPSLIATFVFRLARWCAPEVLGELAFSNKSDVWSFGVVLFELASNGRMPFDDMDTVNVKRFVLGGGHVAMPEKAVPALQRAALPCFAKAPAARPTFAQLEVQLRQALAAAEKAARSGPSGATLESTPLMQAQAPAGRPGAGQQRLASARGTMSAVPEERPDVGGRAEVRTVVRPRSRAAARVRGGGGAAPPGAQREDTADVRKTSQGSSLASADSFVV